jgi:hypothetical protein
MTISVTSTKWLKGGNTVDRYEQLIAYLELLVKAQIGFAFSLEIQSRINNVCNAIENELGILLN